MTRTETKKKTRWRRGKTEFAVVAVAAVYLVNALRTLCTVHVGISLYPSLAPPPRPRLIYPIADPAAAILFGTCIPKSIVLNNNNNNNNKERAPRGELRLTRIHVRDYDLLGAHTRVRTNIHLCTYVCKCMRVTKRYPSNAVDDVQSKGPRKNSGCRVDRFMAEGQGNRCWCPFVGTAAAAGASRGLFWQAIWYNGHSERTARVNTRCTQTYYARTYMPCKRRGTQWIVRRCGLASSHAPPVCTACLCVGLLVFWLYTLPVGIGQVVAVAANAYY
jgi:hypothetical protein